MDNAIKDARKNQSSPTLQTPSNDPPTGPDNDHRAFLHPHWPIFHVDNHLLVLYKPAGLLTQGDETGDPSLLELAKAWIKQEYHKPGRVYLGMVHRLDRPAAGVVAFARTSKAAGRLTAQFRERTTVKRYLAVVEGCMAPPAGDLRHDIERHGRSALVVRKPTPNSKEARLSYRVLATGDDRSLVEIDLHTGRRHQIRVQLSYLGYPILGDLRYGATAPLENHQIALLARELTLEHPTLKTPVTIRCPIPRGWPWPLPESDEQKAPFWEWQAYREQTDGDVQA